jgi:hypothetical protein
MSRRTTEGYVSYIHNNMSRTYMSHIQIEIHICLTYKSKYEYDPKISLTTASTAYTGSLMDDVCACAEVWQGLDLAESNPACWVAQPHVQESVIQHHHHPASPVWGRVEEYCTYPSNCPVVCVLQVWSHCRAHSPMRIQMTAERT